MLSCNREGKWYDEEAKEIFLGGRTTCVPVCPMRCQNGGECTINNQCLCKAEFTGPDCGELKCLMKLPEIDHGVITS